jgi:hypothetical protein
VLEVPLQRFRVVDEPVDHVQVLLPHPTKKSIRTPRGSTSDANTNGGERDANRQPYHISVGLELVPEIRGLHGRRTRGQIREGAGRSGEGEGALTSW